MGVRLIEEVKAAFRRGVKIGDGKGPAVLARMVLLLLAEDARDETRESWIDRDELEALTGCTRRPVMKALDALEAAGLVLRVPIGEGSDGRPITACRGHRTVYRLAQMAVARPVDNPQEGGPERPPLERVRGSLQTERGSVPTGKGVASDPPLRQSRQEPSSLGATIAAAAESRTGREISPEEGEKLLARLLDGRTGIRHPVAWARRVIERGDADGLLGLPQAADEHAPPCPRGCEATSGWIEDASGRPIGRCDHSPALRAVGE